MNTQILNNGEIVYYAVKVNGKIVTTKFKERMLAEQAKLQLPENEKAIAQIVPVTSTGQELLLG